MPGMAALMSTEALFTNSVYLHASDALQQKKRQGGEVENEKGKLIGRTQTMHAWGR